MSDVTLWWMALAVGAVVLVVAIVLLQTFLHHLHQIEEGAEAIWKAGKQVARNTATSWQLAVTSKGLDALTEEALRHDAFLRTGTPQGDGRRKA
jgi:hypothetical protein